ncbi:CDP-glycerol glycerophosphotransferase family protein, partial [Planctomycetota bacterium]
MKTIHSKEPSSENILLGLLKTLAILLGVFRTLLLRAVLLLLSYVVPKNNRLLFFSSVGNYKFPLWKDEQDFQFKESPKYLAIYSAGKLKNFVTVFHIPNKKLFSEIRKLEIRPTKGLRALGYMLRARYIFIDNKNSFNPNASFLKGRFRIIQCWHGTPLKKMGEDKKHGWLTRLRLEYAISSCEHSTQIFRKLLQTENILEIGYPRNDILFNPEFFSCENIDKKLNLPGFAKVFLYAPTHRMRGRAFNPFDKQFLQKRNTATGRKLDMAVNPFDRQFLKSLNEWLRENNYLFLIKQHPYVKSTEGLEQFSNINDASGINQDIQELLIHTDLFICDYSSTLFDFVLTGKPIIFYPYDHKKYAE